MLLFSMFTCYIAWNRRSENDKTASRLSVHFPTIRRTKVHIKTKFSDDKKMIGRFLL